MRRSNRYEQELRRRQALSLLLIAAFLFSVGWAIAYIAPKITANTFEYQGINE